MTDAEQTIQGFMDLLAVTGSEKVAEFMAEHGVWYTPPERPRPKGFRKMTDRRCYGNSFTVMHRGFTYVEGWAANFMGMPIHHAWVVDDEGNMIDPTWRQVGLAYYGVPFAKGFVYDMVAKGMTYGVLDKIDYSQPLPEGAIA